jgi:hypothetical protein
MQPLQQHFDVGESFDIRLGLDPACSGQTFAQGLLFGLDLVQLRVQGMLVNPALAEQGENPGALLGLVCQSHFDSSFVKFRYPLICSPHDLLTQRFRHFTGIPEKALNVIPDGLFQKRTAHIFCGAPFVAGGEDPARSVFSVASVIEIYLPAGARRLRTDER